MPKLRRMPWDVKRRKERRASKGKAAELRRATETVTQKGTRKAQETMFGPF